MNTALGYQDVYYYLGHDGMQRFYRSSDELRRGTFPVNLSYRPDNHTWDAEGYAGYHEANNDTTLIRLIQPAKIYISAYKDATSDHATFAEANRVTTDELSEYFGVAEELTEVPRHLQRKFTKYCKLQYQPQGHTDWFDANFDFALNATNGSRRGAGTPLLLRLRQSRLARHRGGFQLLALLRQARARRRRP